MSILLRHVNSKNRTVSNAAVNALEQVDAGVITQSLPVLTKAARDGDNFVRRIAVWLLGRVGRDVAPNAVVELKKALEDTDPLVRTSAVNSLARLGQTSSRESIPALISALRDDNLYVRSSTAEALGALGPAAAGAVVALIVAAQDREWLVRVTALRALGKVGRGTAETKIVTVLRLALNDGNFILRIAAVEALGEIGVLAESAVPDLTEALQDPETLVSSAAMTALGRIARDGIREAKRAIESALDSPLGNTRSLAANVFWRTGVPVKNAVPQLLRLMSDESAETRAAAARALGTLRPASSEVIDALKLALSKDNDASVRAASANGLANFGNAAKSANREIQKALKDLNPEVRRFALIASGHLGAADGETLAIIQASLEDKNEAVRQQAVWTLVSLGKIPTSFVSTLKKLLQDSALEIRRGAVIVLGRMGPPAKDAVHDLTVLLRESNEQVRLDAVNALGSIGDTAGEVVKMLSQIVVNEREKLNIRQAAATALGKMGSNAMPALPSLKIAMRADDEQVRSTSVDSFTRIGTPFDVLQVLTGDLKSEDVFIRLTAIRGLSTMGPNGKDAVPNLIESLDDEDEQVRNLSASALGNMGIDATKAISALTRAVKGSANPNGNAVEALSQIAVAAQDKGSTELIPQLQAALVEIWTAPH